MPLALQSSVYQDPLFWSIFAGWVLSVVLHEWAHGFVAYLGGDYTIRERGGLSLNPLTYVDPVQSIILPLVFLLLGGIPFPGGSTLVRHDLLRSRAWDAAVSLAGPAMNFLLFLACTLPMHPKIGWIETDPFTTTLGPASVLATLGQMQLLSVFFNLIPIPPLDGFGAISAFMDEENRAKFYAPQVVLISTLILYGVVWRMPGIIQRFYLGSDRIMSSLGFDPLTLEFFRRSYNSILFGQTD